MNDCRPMISLNNSCMYRAKQRVLLVYRVWFCNNLSITVYHSLSYSDGRDEAPRSHKTAQDEPH